MMRWSAAYCAIFWACHLASNLLAQERSTMAREDEFAARLDPGERGLVSLHPRQLSIQTL